ncbi:monocyte to macrophage differentiation factor 2 [Planococcus citri]|uniref:monocyte to macrophage differentiation factor 2 n=1 Tax=Planococcus citri TaxID=170843 RepID=UPI0031F9A91E
MNSHHCSHSWMMNKRLKGKPYTPTEAEHIANIFTHAAMVPIAVIAAIILMINASTTNLFFIAVMYGLNLIILFFISAAFHTAFYFNDDVRLIEKLRKSDRAVIYIFIAACYAPWLMLVQVPEQQMFSNLQWVMWLFAGLGVLFELTCSKKFPLLGIICYVLYAVLPALFLDYQLSFPGIPELKVSGALYLIGVVFYRCDGIVPFAHAIWHLCVILGAGVHYVAVFNHFYSADSSAGGVSKMSEF